MINTDVSSVTYNTAEGQAIYSIPFPFNEDLESGTPELSVALDGVELQYNGTGENGYTITPDGLQLAGTVAANKVLVIKRKIRFVQDYLFQVGLIDAKQIEAAFDDSVMRDQQLAQEIKDLNFAINEEIEALKQKDQDILEEVKLKANKEDVYTKTETDNKLSQKANSSDVYNKETVDSKLSSKAEASNTYTKADVDSKLAQKADTGNTYTKTDVDSKLAQKANKSTSLAGYGIEDSYTKEDVDDKLAQKADSSGVYDKGTIDSKFDAKADKSDTYTKTEVDTVVNQKIAGVYKVKGSVASYNDLPSSGQQTGDVWNVLDTGANYVWTGDAWDKLSETVDLTSCLTKDDAIATYATIASVEEVSEELDTKLAKEQGVANAGKVLGIGEDGNVVPVEMASSDPFPAEDDFIPITYSTTSEGSESFDGAVQINLGALSDGEYEFYVKSKPRSDSNFMRHYFRVTIKDGQIDWQYPATYFTIAFDPTETGSRQTRSGSNWAVRDLRGTPIYGGKINNDYIIECKSGYLNGPGSFRWTGITNGDEIGQVSKVRNVATQETVTPIITLKHSGDVVDPSLSSQYIGNNPFYLELQQTTTKSTNVIYPSNTTKIISLGMWQALRPGSDVVVSQRNLYPAKILVSIYSVETSSELDFVFKSDRAGISIQETKATGAFVGTKYAVYANSAYPSDYMELVLSKDSAFGFNSEKYMVSVTETGVGSIRSLQRVIVWDMIPSEFSLLQEITPIPEAALPTGNGTYTLELTIVDDIVITSWNKLDVYSKEETDQQIQDAIGTIETALAEV